MAFLVHSTDDGRVPGIEYLPCSAIQPVVGMALLMSGGNLALASAANAPTYLSMVEAKEKKTAGDIIPVQRIQEDVIYETTFSVAATAIKPGMKVTLAADGLQVTATTDSGVAEVVWMEGTAQGSRVRVRFN